MMSFLTQKQLDTLAKIENDHHRKIMRDMMLRLNLKEVEDDK